MMRTARTDDDLVNARSEFRRADNGRLLGPWPAIYRLSVLFRLGQTEQINEELPGIAERLDAWNPDDHQHTLLQHDALNALEVLVYALNLDYASLEGRGVRTESGAFAIGVYPGRDDVRMPWRLARDEVDLILNQQPGACGLRLPRDQRRAEIRPPGRDWQPVGHRPARLLVAMHRCRSTDPDSVRTATIGERGLKANYRTILKETRTILSNAFDLPRDQVILQSRAGSPLQFDPIIKLVGAVDAHCYFDPAA